MSDIKSSSCKPVTLLLVFRTGSFLGERTYGIDIGADNVPHMEVETESLFPAGVSIRLSTCAPEITLNLRRCTTVAADLASHCLARQSLATLAGVVVVEKS
jgi:hypothetical protein